MRLLTRDQSREMDRIAMEEMGVSGLMLMGNAGREVANAAKSMLKEMDSPKIAILCGKGNNGGDGYAAALHLDEFKVTIYSIPEIEALEGDALYYFRKCQQKKMKIIHGATLPDSEDFDLIIDGLLGTGFRGELRSPLKEWVQWINEQDIAVLSIDIPSGVDANNGVASENSVWADVTVTMGFTKVGMMLNPGFQQCGDIIPVEIGFPSITDQLSGNKWETFEEELVLEYLAPPSVDTYKHRQGKILILAGSTGMTGAATLSTMAALRSGAGLTITCAPSSLNAVYETNIMEGMTLSCEDQGLGYLTEKNYEKIESYLDWCDVILMGPGLGANVSTENLIEKLIVTSEKPLVIDADGLRCLAKNPQLFSRFKAPYVITPHYGELAAIIGVSKGEIKVNLPEILEKFMHDFPGILVAKNAPTCIAFRDRIVVNITGNQGLATAGTGDVLTGVIAGFMAQGIPTFEAAMCGVFIHGLAGDLAGENLGYRGLLAGDVMEAIPDAIQLYEYC